MWNKCVHGGGNQCLNHGGTGELVHGVNYLHKHINVLELDIYSQPGVEIPNTVEHKLIKALDEFVEDESLANTMLAYNVFDNIKKSIYHFDLVDKEGIERVLELLPILDEQIVRDVYATVFTNYPVDDDSFFNVRVARLELRGYFMDFLATHDTTEFNSGQAINDNETGVQTPNDALASEARNEPPGNQNLSE